ncbi:DMT family transporter [Halomonas denitrificans]|uniref:DMT family transporter n=1 Tax=Halomonas TaxID=2745 RepID=UPI001A8E9F4E|nr:MULTISPECIES: DMT family transporter [Halomonas]MED5296528.1 DMT family transporter [Pseudomonadota bacterium]MBN8413794.1 DMT family transporter [Halomonas litopenaei]MBY5926635.1 DMT family transporter [Halomonas sp. DP4Y7-2]MBY5928588.1 DMT family transporter [Halomonas sp. DP8Y7-3]MBY5967758.1 DMT family transporter [Halomonas denitrificans]
MASSVKGIGFMCLGVLCLALGDAISKWLGEVHSPVQIIFFRTLVSLPMIMLLAWRGSGLRTLATRRPGVHLVRGLIYTGTMGCFVLGLTLMPLAEGTAIAFAAPLFVSLLSVPLLGEKVSMPVLCASLVGFVGVLVVVRPGSDGISLGALAMLGAAVFYALMMITARRYGAREHLWAMVFYMTLVPFVITGLALPLVWQAPEAAHWPAFLMAGVLGVGATAFITLAFRHAPAAIAAPFDYTAMLWAVLLGWLFWGELPDWGVWVGGTLIIASGLAIAYQEGRTSLKRRPTA